MQVINQLADRFIESYWNTRPFNKNAIKQVDQNHRSKFCFSCFEFYLNLFLFLVSFSNCLNWSRINDANIRHQVVSIPLSSLLELLILFFR